MKVLGVVQWANRDKAGIPIAGVRPLLEVQKSEWREIDPLEEFPSQGQIFWPNAQAANEGALVLFRAEMNAGQKDEYKVVDPKPAFEVLDCRSYGTIAEVRSLLSSGVKVAGPVGTLRVFVWCSPDTLVGPVDLVKVATGTAKLASSGQHRIATFTTPKLRTVTVDRTERIIRLDDGTPSGHIDWDDDAVVLRRALEAAVRISKARGPGSGQTKKQIEEAVRELHLAGSGPDASLDQFRLQHSLAVLKRTELSEEIARELADKVLDHPRVRHQLEELSSRAVAEVETKARAALAAELAEQQEGLLKVAEERAQTRAEVDLAKADLEVALRALEQVKSDTLLVAAEAEAAVQRRIAAALERPLELLAEASVLRPLLGSVRAHENEAGRLAAPLRWSPSTAKAVDDDRALRRELTVHARARGVDPAVMLQIHAAVVARLMPVTLGPASMAALAAYSHALCAGRLLVSHVSPTTIHHRELIVSAGNGVDAAALAAEPIDGVCMLVLEGANRSPLEASVLPLLQMTQLGLSDVALAPGLRLAATLVTGATTVPVPSQLWSHGVALMPEHASATPSPLPPPGDLALGADAMVPGEAPVGVLESLMETWPDVNEVRPTLNSFGSALSRLYRDEREVSEALLHCVVLPFIATALSPEEQLEALRHARDADGKAAAQLRRLRKKLC